MLRRPLSLFGVALLVAVFFGLIGSASARHRNRESVGAPER